MEDVAGVKRGGHSSMDVPTQNLRLDHQDVVASMLACGEQNGSGVDPTASFQEMAQRLVCVKRAGYTRRDGFDPVHCTPRNR